MTNLTAAYSGYAKAWKMSNFGLTQSDSHIIGFNSQTQPNLNYSNCLYRMNSEILKCHSVARGPGSAVGIATGLRARRSGNRIPVGARFFAPV